MAEQGSEPRWWQRGAQRLTSSRLGAQAAAKALPGLDRATLRLSGGRASR